MRLRSRAAYDRIGCFDLSQTNIPASQKYAYSRRYIRLVMLKLELAILDMRLSQLCRSGVRRFS